MGTHLVTTDDDELFCILQYLNYRKHFKNIFQQEKEVEEQRKGLMALHPKVIRARRQVLDVIKLNNIN